MTHQGAACDAASVHFGPTIRMTDILVSREDGAKKSINYKASIKQSDRDNIMLYIGLPLFYFSHICYV